MSLNVGDVIDDKYRILRLVGEGGMGAVYEGENRLIARRVAIKVLYGAASMSADAVQRFEREAQAAGRIGNDHILEVIDLGRLSDGARYMVMEFLDGETLGERIKRVGRLAPTELVPLFKQVLVGLQAAHDAGIVHRDLKPDNIFILKEKAGHRDFAKIIDFGISKFLDPSDHNMTRTGTVMGTPFYMSPEQAKGIGVDARSDVYAVGAMLYEAVSGSVPFDGKTFNELMFKIVLSDPRPLAELVPDLDPGFATIVLKGMARDAQHRFQTARDFASALDRWATTGASVTVPPEASAAAREFGATALPAITPAAAPAVAVGAVTPGGGATHGSWANSQTQAPSKSQRNWLPLAIGGGVLLLGALIAVAMSGGDPDASSAGAAGNAGVAKAAAESPAVIAPAVAKPEGPAPAVRPVTDSVQQAPAATSSAPAAVAKKEPRAAAPAPAPEPEKTAPKPAPAAPKKPATGKPKVDFGY